MIGSVLCLSLLAGSAAFALAQTQGPSFAACAAKGRNGEFPVGAIVEEGAPGFSYDGKDDAAEPAWSRTLNFYNLPSAGLPKEGIAIPLPLENGPFSAEGEGLRIRGEQKDAHTVLLQINTEGADGGYLDLSCTISPSSDPLACDLPADMREKVEHCASFLAAQNPACMGREDSLTPLYDEAVKHMRAYLPAWYTGGSPGSVQDLLGSGDGEIMTMLAAIESSCGRRLNIAPDAPLPPPMPGIFSPQDFTVYLSDTFSDPHRTEHLLFATVIGLLQQVGDSCARGKAPSPDACASAHSAAVSSCTSLVRTFRDVPDYAIRKFLCSL